MRELITCGLQKLLIAAQKGDSAEVQQILNTLQDRDFPNFIKDGTSGQPDRDRAERVSRSLRDIKIVLHFNETETSTNVIQEAIAEWHSPGKCPKCNTEDRPIERTPINQANPPMRVFECARCAYGWQLQA